MTRWRLPDRPLTWGESMFALGFFAGALFTFAFLTFIKAVTL